tara:strand:- start:32 stop:262 length:231 start_codon:yes stop_codon:yes gene_type:complete
VRRFSGIDNGEILIHGFCFLVPVPVFNVWLSGNRTPEVKPTSLPSVEYALTDLGQELIPAIQAIVEVGHKIKMRAQ